MLQYTKKSMNNVVYIYNNYIKNYTIQNKII